MSRPLIIDSHGDRVEQATCDLCSSTRDVRDEVVGGYGSVCHFVVLDLCAVCREHAFDKAEQMAGERIDQDRAALPADVRERTLHGERMGWLAPWPPDTSGHRRPCRVCRGPSCACDREPRPADDDGRERRLREREQT